MIILLSDLYGYPGPGGPRSNDEDPQLSEFWYHLEYSIADSPRNFSKIKFLKVWKLHNVCEECDGLHDLHVLVVLLLPAPPPPHLHNALVHAPEQEIEHLLPVCPDDVGQEILPKLLHLQGEDLLGAEMGVPSAYDIPGDVEVVGTSDDVVLDNHRNLLLDAFGKTRDWLEFNHVARIIVAPLLTGSAT